MTHPTVAYALLCQLAKEPLTGYELSRRMRGGMSNYWSAPHSQIYPQLGKLVATGWVRYETAAGPGPRDKKIYRITDAGIAALRAWLAEPVDRQPERDELVLKVSASWLDPGALATTIATTRQEAADKLRGYLEIASRIEASLGDHLTDPTSPESANYATLQCGISYERHRVSWLDWVADYLQSANTSNPGASTNPSRS
ncbi:MAG: PadR family transcriptional regulator [Mycobacteriales bacterium]